MKPISDVNVENFTKCSVCVKAKYTKKPFKPVTSRQTTLLELVHSDLVTSKTQPVKEEKGITSPL